ncbi:MAG: NAD(P)-dependent alcohol dehydrogenase [Haliangiales bacterium]
MQQSATLQPIVTARAESPASAPSTQRRETSASAARDTMSAIVHPAYGSPSVLRHTTVARATIGANEVLVRVHAAAVCRGDVHILTGKPYLIRAMGYGLVRPKHPILGQDIAGTVEAVGDQVSQFRPGDEVYGQVGHSGFAEYVAAPAERLAPKPTNLSFEQAAAVPDSGMTALQGLRDLGQLKRGQSVLINGASGGVGTFAVQIARALGARVTAVCSTRHIGKLRSIGADHVVDYTREDFTQLGERYDAIFDLVGNRRLSEYRRVLAPTGIYISSGGESGGNWISPLVWLAKVALTDVFVSQRIKALLVQPRQDDLIALQGLIESGQIEPVIERQYPLSEAIDAVRHVAAGHAQGKTVIRM